MRNILILYFLFIPLIAFSQIPIRVQNGQNLQTAIDNAPTGSTILVDGGNYNEIIINKRINLVGAGAFVANPTIIPIINVIAGSDNSVIMGFKVSEFINIGYKVNNLLIKENYILSAIRTLNSNCTSDCGPINNLNIIHNLVYTINLTSDSEIINNFTIRNNILASCAIIGVNGQTMTGNVINNTFFWFYINASNNIYILYNYSSTSCRLGNTSNVNFKNNIINHDPSNYSDYCPRNYPQGFNYNLLNWNLSGTNTVLLDYNLIFLGFPSNIAEVSIPLQFQLTPDSPARGVGENGVDCGAFGGSDPFPLSGAIGPQIYELSAPSSVSSGQTLNVTVKAKVSN